MPEYQKILEKIPQSLVDVEYLHAISGTITWRLGLFFVLPEVEAVQPLLSISATIPGPPSTTAFSAPTHIGTGMLRSVDKDGQNAVATYVNPVSSAHLNVPISVSVWSTEAAQGRIVPPDGRPGGRVAGLAHNSVSSTVTLTAAAPRATGIDFELVYMPPPA